MISFDYESNKYSLTKAPYLKFTLTDPLGKINKHFKGLVDTGYDGELLLPYQGYDLKKIGKVIYGKQKYMIDF